MNTSMQSEIISRKKRLQLVGKTISPVIVKNYIFYIKGCKVTITREFEYSGQWMPPYPRKIHLGKLITGERKAPTIRNGYMGYIIIDLPRKNTQAKKRLACFIQLEALGALQNEGMGKIQWIEKRIVDNRPTAPPKKRLNIRKGLGHYPKPMVTAIKALLLHDFVHTAKHESKIYQEVEIQNTFIREACVNHHENGEIEQSNWLIPIIKKYDGLAAFLNRRVPRREERRYDYPNGRINCTEIAEIIKEKQHNIHTLYNYIYYDKTFARFYEAIDFANNKLRNHLLIAVNLIINDFKKGRIIVQHNKLKIVSLPTRDKGETEKPISKSLVLKRINSSKKGQKTNC